MLFRPLPYPDPDRLVSVSILRRGHTAEYEQIAQNGKTWKALHENMRSVEVAIHSGDANGVNFVAPGNQTLRSAGSYLGGILPRSRRDASQGSGIYRSGRSSRRRRGCNRQQCHLANRTSWRPFGDRPDRHSSRPIVRSDWRHAARHLNQCPGGRLDALARHNYRRGRRRKLRNHRPSAAWRKLGPGQLGNLGSWPGHRRRNASFGRPVRLFPSSSAPSGPCRRSLGRHC